MCVIQLIPTLLCLHLYLNSFPHQVQLLLGDPWTRRVFVSELARLFCAAGEKSALEGIAIKAALTLCSLVLQKPTRNSKEKHHVKCLERCLQL